MIKAISHIYPTLDTLFWTFKNKKKKKKIEYKEKKKKMINPRIPKLIPKNWYQIFLNQFFFYFALNFGFCFVFVMLVYFCFFCFFLLFLVSGILKHVTVIDFVLCQKCRTIYICLGIVLYFCLSFLFFFYH